MHKYLVAVFIFLFTMNAFATEHHPEAFLASIQNNPNKGQEIYTHFCATCHAAKPLIAIGAPRAHVKADWTPYISHQTINQMISLIDPGLGAMPARGGCFECTDGDLKSAIEYMLLEK